VVGIRHPALKKYKTQHFNHIMTGCSPRRGGRQSNGSRRAASRRRGSALPFAWSARASTRETDELRWLWKTSRVHFNYLTPLSRCKGTFKRSGFFFFFFSFLQYIENHLFACRQKMYSYRRVTSVPCCEDMSAMLHSECPVTLNLDLSHLVAITFTE